MSVGGLNSSVVARNINLPPLEGENEKPTESSRNDQTVPTVPVSETVAFQLEKETTGTGGGNWLIGIIKLMGGLGMFSAEAGESLIRYIKERQLESKKQSSMEEDPHIPQFDENTGEVKVFDEASGEFEVIYEPGDMTVAGGGGGGGTINRPTRTGGNGEDDDKESDGVSNTEAAQQAQTRWTQRIVKAIAGGSMTAKQVRDVLIILDELGDKIDIKNRIKIVTAALQALPGGLQAPSPDIDYAVEQYLETNGLDDALSPFVKTALEEELKKEGPNADLVEVVAELLTSSGRDRRFRTRILDAINGVTDQSDLDYGISITYYGATAANEMYQTAITDYLRPDGKLHVGNRTIDPPVTATDIMYFKAAVMKQHRAGNIHVDAEGVIENRSVAQALLDMDNMRPSGVGQDTTALKQQLKQQLDGVYDVPVAVRIEDGEVGPATIKAFSSHYGQGNGAIAKLVGAENNSIVLEFKVPALITDARGGQFFTILNVPAEPFLETINSKNLKAIEDGQEPSAENIDYVFQKGDLRIEIMNIPGISENGISGIRLPNRTNKLEGWVPVNP